MDMRHAQDCESGTIIRFGGVQRMITRMYGDSQGAIYAVDLVFKTLEVLRASQLVEIISDRCEIKPTI